MGKKKVGKDLVKRLSALASSCPWGGSSGNPCDPCNDRPSAKDKAEFVAHILPLLSQDVEGGATVVPPPEPQNNDQGGPLQGQVAVAPPPEPQNNDQEGPLRGQVADGLKKTKVDQTNVNSLIKELGGSNENVRAFAESFVKYYGLFAPLSGGQEPFKFESSRRTALWQALKGFASKTKTTASQMKILSLVLGPFAAVIAIHALNTKELGFPITITTPDKEFVKILPIAGPSASSAELIAKFNEACVFLKLNDDFKNAALKEGCIMSVGERQVLQDALGI